MSFIVKNTTLPNILDLLVPHSCRGCGHLGKVLCERCKNNIISKHINFCPKCKSKTIHGACKKCKSLPPIFVVGQRSSLLGKLIHDFKYDSVRALAQPLAEIMNEILPQTTNETLIIPLPTISRHVRERGLDHTYLIAKELAKIRHYKVQRILIRNKNTVQVGTDRKTRLSQAKSAYMISPKIRINKNATYILLDDVWTTGASMESAIKKLRGSGVNQIIIALLAVS